MLLNIFAADIFVAVYPIVAQATEGNEVVNIEAKRRITSPRLDVVGTQATRSSMGRTTTGAMVVVPLVDCPDNLFPVARRVQPLTLWRTAIFVIVIGFARSARHAVGFATNPRLFSLGFIAQYLARFGAVGLAKKCRDGIRAAHVAIVGVGEVVATRTCWDAKLN